MAALNQLDALNQELARALAESQQAAKNRQWICSVQDFLSRNLP
ncbi:hypothetical protein [Mesorhizobium sp.]|nr:hypothetical protein [Mesorhizobium sp.]